MNHASRIPDGFDHTLLAFSMVEPLKPISFQQAEPPVEPDAQYERQKFKVRLASSDERRASAQFLVEKMYAWRGYHAAAASAPQRTPRRISLLVYGRNNHPIGTVSVGFDGPNGLMADDLYRQELDALRQRGSRLLELCKFAIDRRSGNSNRIVASLLNVAYVYGKIANRDAVVLEVNPRHVAYYESKFGFHQIGKLRVCVRVNAPAILLALDFSHIAEQVRKLGGMNDNGTPDKTLYRYFLSEEEEAALTQRLTGGTAPA